MSAAPASALPPDDPSLSPQANLVLHHLRAAGSITGVEAAAVHRIRHLPRRIKDLKEAGYAVLTEPCRDVTGQRYARYRLEREGPQPHANA